MFGWYEISGILWTYEMSGMLWTVMDCMSCFWLLRNIWDVACGLLRTAWTVLGFLWNLWVVLGCYIISRMLWTVRVYTGCFGLQ